MSCLGGREPPRISTITWANCLGHAAVIAAAAGDGSRGAAGRTFAAFRAERARPPGLRSCAAALRDWLGPRVLFLDACAAWQPAPCVSQSKGGAASGTVMSRMTDAAPTAGEGGR